MKLPSKIRSMIDEMGLKSSEKTKVLRHLNDMADSLPEHPTPAEAKRIVGGALKSLKITVGGDDESKDEEPKKEKKEKKEEKPKEEKKEKVDEAKKLSFKAFLSEAGAVEFRIEDSDLEDYGNAIQFEVKITKLPTAVTSKLKALDADYFTEDGFTTISLENKNKDKLKKILIDLGYVEVKRFS